MAENMAVNRHPDQHMLKAYGEWSDGGWGMIQTGAQGGVELDGT